MQERDKTDAGIHREEAGAGVLPDPIPPTVVFSAEHAAWDI